MASTGHPLSLWARDLVAASRDDCLRDEAQVDVSFLHRGFCIIRRTSTTDQHSARGHHFLAVWATMEP